MNKNFQELEEAVARINDYLEKGREPFLTESVIQVEDLTHMTESLTGKSQECLKRVSKALTLTEDGLEYKCIFLGVRTTEKWLKRTVERVSRAVNALSDLNLIHSCLAPISRIQLAIMPMELPTSVVICFVLVPALQEAEAKRLAGISFEEGETAKSEEELEKYLGPGEFYGIVHLTHQFASLNPKPVKESLQDAIDQYLQVLPKGTEVVAVNECAIMGLSLPFEVIFRNPLMKNYKEVRLNHHREVVAFEDTVKQFSLLDSVEYIKKNNS